jgi:hypothetical protein
MAEAQPRDDWPITVGEFQGWQEEQPGRWESRSTTSTKGST